MATTAGSYFATVNPVSGEVLKEFAPRLRWYGQRGPEIAADEPLTSEAGDAVVVNEPLGVLGGFTG